jgi:hypothetical protein
MSEQIKTKAELMSEIEQDWNALDQTLGQLSEKQMTTLRDAQGWSVKDHIIHLTAWERSVLFMFRGKPRHEGLGVDAAVYYEGDDDKTNAIVQAKTRDLSLNDALAQFRDVHQSLMQLLEPLSDQDLHRRVRHYVPTDPGEGDGPVVINVIDGNTANHFREHKGWIEALVAQK